MDGQSSHSSRLQPWKPLVVASYDRRGAGLPLTPYEHETLKSQNMKYERDNIPKQLLCNFIGNHYTQVAITRR